MERGPMGAETPTMREVQEGSMARVAMRLVRLAVDVLAHEGALRRVDRKWVDTYLRYPKSRQESTTVRDIENRA
jgi:hypothetical protein